jgi:diguanylate cyclase (GGDEF)-like protein/PAS domain S-box-containing protein
MEEISSVPGKNHMAAFEDPEIYRDILNELQIGVSVLDLQKKIVFWSHGAEEITGYTRIDVLGHPCTDNVLLHCDQNKCEMCNEKCSLVVALHDAKPVEAVGFIRHKSGHQTPVHTWTIPLRDQHGLIVGLIQTFEGDVAVNGPDPNDRSMKERGWLDDVTGLPNQAMMHSHLREALGTFAEMQIPFGVVCVEVHEIGKLRARYGQEAEKSMLQVLARTLKNTVWPTDFVGRWNEHRFLAILGGCNDDELQSVSQRMLRMTASATIEWWGEDLSLKVSTVRTSAQSGDTVTSLLQRTQLSLDPSRIESRAILAGTASSSEGSQS